MGDHFAGFRHVVGVGGNRPALGSGLGLRDDFGEFVSNGDNGNAIHAEDRFQGDDGLRMSQGALSFESNGGVLGHGPWATGGSQERSVNQLRINVQ